MRPALILLALLLAVSVSAAPVRQHGAHVHGEATLNIVRDGNALSIWLNAPAMSLLGFEHAPRDDTQRHAYDKALDILREPAAWLVPAASGGCTSESVIVQDKGLDGTGAIESAHGKHGHEHRHDDEHADTDEQQHADIDAYYRYSCRAPLSLRTLEVALFERFPGLHRINVNLVLEDRQGSQVLLPDAHEVGFSQ